MAGKKLSTLDIKAIVAKEIHGSMGYLGGEIVNKRNRSLEYYLGYPFGNEQEGRSQVVSTDVSDTIESLLPSLMRVFTAGENVFACAPVGPEDEEMARQCSDYMNYIFYKENDGFMALYTAFKDALIQKNGILKVYWDDSYKIKREEYTRLNDDEFSVLVSDGEVKVKNHSEYEEPILDETGKELDKLKLHDVVIERHQTYGQVRIEPVPPEEFLIERRAKSIDSANFVAHRVTKTRSELVEMGYDPDVVAKLPSGDAAIYNQDKVTRYGDVDVSRGFSSGDHSTDEVVIHECYVRLDVDGKGRAKLYKVTVGGDGNYDTLDMQEVDSIPFISMTPVPMPHRFYGRSISELVEDIQLIKSTIIRQVLDNMYLTNNARIAVQDGQVSMDDLLTNRPGGIVRTKQPPQNVMFPMTTPPLSNQAFPLLEYLDSVKETRTGVTRISQGLDADSLNKTATATGQILNQTQMRMELIARIFAETGVKDLGRKIYELVCKYQQKEKIIRLRNTYIPMRPFEWKDKMNISINVGLGTGSKEQQLILLNAILERQMQAINLQQNVYGPMVNLRNIYNTLRKITENAGLNGPDPYFMDPEVGAQQMPELPPKPPSEFENVTLAQVQGENERAILESQTRAKELESKMKQSLLDFELKIKELELKYNTQINEAEMRDASSVEKEKVRQQGDIMKQVLQGQQKFFGNVKQGPNTRTNQ